LSDALYSDGALGQPPINRPLPGTPCSPTAHPGCVHAGDRNRLMRTRIRVDGVNRMDRMDGDSMIRYRLPSLNRLGKIYPKELNAKTAKTAKRARQGVTCLGLDRGVFGAPSFTRLSV